MSEKKLTYEEFVQQFIDGINEQTPQIRDLYEQAKNFPMFEALLDKFTRDLYEDYIKGKL